MSVQENCAIAIGITRTSIVPARRRPNPPRLNCPRTTTWVIATAVGAAEVGSPVFVSGRGGVGQLEPGGEAGELFYLLRAAVNLDLVALGKFYCPQHRLPLVFPQHRHDLYPVPVPKIDLIERADRRLGKNSSNHRGAGRQFYVVQVYPAYQVGNPAPHRYLGMNNMGHPNLFQDTSVGGSGGLCPQVLNPHIGEQRAGEDRGLHMGAANPDYYAIAISDAELSNGSNIGGIGLCHLAQDAVITVYYRFV